MKLTTDEVDIMSDLLSGLRKASKARETLLESEDGNVKYALIKYYEPTKAGIGLDLMILTKLEVIGLLDIFINDRADSLKQWGVEMEDY